MICPSGKVLRKSYTRKGKRVGASCIRSTSSHKQSSANFKKSVSRRMTLRMKGVSTTRPRCSTGKISRKAYVRVSKTGKRTLVPASCIPDRGRPGKRSSPGIGPLHKGELTKFGYEKVMSLSVADRHSALAKAVKAYGPLATWRKVNAVYVYTKNTSPALSEKYNADRKWIQQTYGLKAF